MHEPNRTCQICGKPYYACRKCEEVNSPRQTTDRNECYAIYVILTALRQGVITKGEARTKLNDIGITNENITSKFGKFLPEIYSWIEDIVKVPVIKKPRHKKNK